MELYSETFCSLEYLRADLLLLRMGDGYLLLNLVLDRFGSVALEARALTL